MLPRAEHLPQFDKSRAQVNERQPHPRFKRLARQWLPMMTRKKSLQGMPLNIAEPCRQAIFDQNLGHLARARQVAGKAKARAKLRWHVYGAHLLFPTLS